MLRLREIAAEDEYVCRGASMSFTFELRWLLLLPVGAIVVFALWVLWNLSCEIGARKRRWVITYRESEHNDQRARITIGSSINSTRN